MLPAAAHDARLPLNSVNGWMEMGAAAAIIGGVILALQVVGDFRPGLPLILVLLLALNTVCFVLAVPTHFPSDACRPEPRCKRCAGFFRDTGRIFAETESRGSLLGMAVFQGIITAGSGAIFTLALDNAASGHTAAMYALVLVCAGVALGCLLASFKTHPRRTLGLVPFGVTGLLVADVWAALGNVHGVAPAAPSLLLGIMGGVVNVPLRTTYLAAVPADARGNAMSVMNTFIYLMTTAIALVMYGLVEGGVLPTAVAQMWFVVATVAVGAARVVVAAVSPGAGAVGGVAGVADVPYPRPRSGSGSTAERGPLLLIANHTSYFDPFWVAKVAPPGAAHDDQRLLRSANHPLADGKGGAGHPGAADFFPPQGARTGRSGRGAARGRLRVAFSRVVPAPQGGGAAAAFWPGRLAYPAPVPDTPVAVLWIEGGWGSFASYKGGRPMKGKRLDWWRTIDVAVSEPRPLDADILADHRRTRRYLMRACLKARGILGLEVPMATEEAVEEDERGAPP